MAVKDTLFAAAVCKEKFTGTASCRRADHGKSCRHFPILYWILDVPEEHFYTSALATAAFLKEQAAGCSAFVIGEAGLLNALYDVGITMNDVNPDYVVVGEGRSYSLDTLTKATNLVLKGAKLIGANSDVSGPIENGIAPASYRARPQKARAGGSWTGMET